MAENKAKPADDTKHALVPGAVAAANGDDNDPVKAMRHQREQALRDGDNELADRLAKSLGDQA